MTEEEVLKEDEVEDAVTVDDELVVDDMFTHRVLDEHRQQVREKKSGSLADKL